MGPVSIRFASSMDCLLIILLLSVGDISFWWYWDLVFHSLGCVENLIQNKMTLQVAIPVRLHLPYDRKHVMTAQANGCTSNTLSLCLSSPILLMRWEPFWIHLNNFCTFHFYYILPYLVISCKCTEKTITSFFRLFSCHLV